MWEIILGIVLIILGLGMIMSGFILFFAFNLNGWYIVFLFAVGIALVLLGIILMILTNNYRTNQKLKLESSTNKYIMADPNLLKEQSAIQKQTLNKPVPALNDDTQYTNGGNIGLLDNSQNETISDISNDISTEINTPQKIKPKIEDDEDSLFVF